MTWSYHPLLDRPMDEVRLAIGDTVEKDPQLQDEEIHALLLRQPDPRVAAPTACRRLAAHYARSYDSTSGPEKRNAGMLAQHYADLARSLLDEVVRGSPGASGQLAATIRPSPLGQPHRRRR